MSIGGASAGANLSAGATVRLRDAGGSLPASLILIYPVLHETVPPMNSELSDFLASLPGGGGLPPEAGKAINAIYFGSESPTEIYAHPGGHDMSGMPRTLIVTAEHDSLRPSGEAFADDLERGGVRVELVMQKNAQHGYLNEVGDPDAAHTIGLMLETMSQ